MARRVGMGGGASKGSTDQKPLGQAGRKAPSTLAIAATAPPRNWNDEFQRALDLLDAEDHVHTISQKYSTE